VYIELVHIIRKDIDWKKKNRLAPGSDYVYSVMIDGQEYNVSGRFNG